jgi:hypothetical protein
METSYLLSVPCCLDSFVQHCFDIDFLGKDSHQRHAMSLVLIFMDTVGETETCEIFSLTQNLFASISISLFQTPRFELSNLVHTLGINGWISCWCNCYLAELVRLTNRGRKWMGRCGLYSESGRLAIEHLSTLWWVVRPTQVHDGRNGSRRFTGNIYGRRIFPCARRW